MIIRFDDPDRLISIPPLECEEVSDTAIANHVRQYLQRREPKWHVEMSIFRESGVVVLKRRNIAFKVFRN